MDLRFFPTAQIPSRHAQGWIFVVSHMRSFSTLLCHILGSHEEIAGYVETHQSYLGRIDLHRLTRTIRETTDDPLVRRYALDKILHNYVHIAPSVLSRSDVKILFLLRNAEDTLKSILNLFHGQPSTAPISDPESALDYYVTRLKQIEQYSAQLGRNARFLESEQLLDETDAVLEGLAQWLGLSEPLSPNYRTFKFTGEDYFGDPSPAIKTGKIVASAETRHEAYLPIAIPETVLQRGREAHAACRETLLANQGRL
jgi:hypothetical protein